MAQINWKVAVIGVIALAMFAGIGVVAYLHFNKDPQKLYSQGQQMLADVIEESEQRVAKGNYTEDDISEMQVKYKEAQYKFGGAYDATKDEQFKIQILFDLVEYHKIDNVFHEGDWRKANACLQKILVINPENIEANKQLLESMLETANSIGETGSLVDTQVWKMIQQYSGDLIAAQQEHGESPEEYVRVAKAKSLLMIAKSGQSTDIEGDINEVISELEELKQLFPSNVEIYNFLAQAAAIRAGVEESKGVLNAAEKSLETQYIYLQEGIDANPQQAQAYINFLKAQLPNVINDMESYDKLEADFLAVADKFPNDPEIYRALAPYYSVKFDTFDKMIEALSYAQKLEPENIRISIELANAYFRKGSVFNDVESFEFAARICKEALTLPDAQEVKGPRQSANKINRVELYSLLAMNSFEIAYSSQGQAREQWVVTLEEMVHNLNQLYGDEKHPSAMQWNGILDVAREDYDAGILKLYDAYRQFRATATLTSTGKYIHPNLKYISYVLARLYKNRNEIGLYKQFLEDALSNQIVAISPDALLDYSDILIKARQYSDAIRIVTAYKNKLPNNTRADMILLKAYAGSNESDKAQEIIAELDPLLPEVILAQYQIISNNIRRLQAEKDTSGIDQLQNQRVALLEKLLINSPESAPIPLDALRYYYDNDQSQLAINLLDKYLEYIQPESNTFNSTYIQAKVLRLQAQEPDPTNISQERNSELVYAVINEIPDNTQKIKLLASYYKSINDDENALEYFKQAYRLESDNHDLLSELFEAALKLEDKEAAAKYAEIAKAENVDGCNGKLFSSRIDMMNKDFKDAVIKLDQCVEIRPAAPVIYLLSSQCETNLGNHEQAIEDAKTALQMNFMDGQISKVYVAAISARNDAAKPNVSLQQQQELENALGNAISLNPTEWKLRGLYAEVISETKPEMALAVRQQLAKSIPNIETYTMLANMAMRMASKNVTPDKAKVLMEIAGDAYANAYQLAPTNEAVIQSYSEYFRITKQQDKATALFGENESLLWQFHLRDGQYEAAKKLLLTEYSKTPADSKTLIGLITVSNKLGDTDGIINYSRELVAADKNAENMLFAAQTLLEKSLLDESEKYISALKSEYPQENRTVLLEAWQLLSKGHPKESLSLIDGFLAEEPESAKALHLRGQINRLIGNLDQAIADFQKSNQISTNAQTQIDLAKTYAQQGKTTVAIGLLKDSISSGQADVQSRLILESLYRSENRETELVNLYNETLQKYPDSSAWYLKAGQYMMSTKNYINAEQLLLNAWELSQSSGGNQSALSTYLACLVDSEKYEEANKFASQYIDSQYSPIAYAYLGLIQLKLGDNDKGIQYYHTALEKVGDQNDNMISTILSHMLGNAGQQAVVDWCNLKLSDNPNSIPANFAMFRLSQKINDFASASKYISKCMDIVGQNSPQWPNFAVQKALLMTAGYMQTSEHQYLEQAIGMYESILKLPNNSNNGDILNNLAYLLADNNERIEDAVVYAEQANKLNPTDPSRMDTYAYTLIKSGKYEQAEEILLSAIVLYESNNKDVIWDVYYHLGMAQQELNKANESVESYNRALELAGDSLSEKMKEKIQTAIKKVK